jgi:ATP-dependent DNA helicase DinG
MGKIFDNKKIEAAGGDAFAEYMVPHASLRLKQGFGRLIRAKTDRGVLALLDTRISRMPYGKIFLGSLPPYRTTQDLADVRHFLAAEPPPEPHSAVKRSKRARSNHE